LTCRRVLTFDYQHAPVVLADIVLCVPVVRSEARAQRKAFREHLAHLLVHGVLHAQGHDHDRAARARKMEAEEVRILGGLGIDDPYREGGVAGG
jgi:probable rRNA maturation factor